MKFNMNSIVKVQLTDAGREHHKSNYEDLYKQLKLKAPPYVPPKEDAEGWSIWQLWHLMEVFGPVTGMGMPQMMESDIEIPCKYDSELWAVKDLVDSVETSQ